MDRSKCALDEDEPCLISYDFADRKKWRSDTKACRTVPSSLRNDVVGNDEFKFGNKKKNNKKGICSFAEDCDTCKFSWLKDTSVDSGKWKGFSAMFRCQDSSN